MTEPVIIGDARATRIYALCEYPGEEVRYVGKTVQPLYLRLREHLRIARRGPRLPVGRWLAKRKAAGLNVAIKWLETIDDSKGWAEREAHWIARYRAEGADLLNLTDGGEGLPGHRFSPEHKAKIAAAIRTGSWFSCEVCGKRFWRKRGEIRKGDCRFCSRPCYAQSLRGKSRSVPRLMVERGVAAAAALRKAKTTCPQGHPYAGDNLYLYADGRRACKTCRIDAKRRYRARGGRG